MKLSKRLYGGARFCDRPSLANTALIDHGVVPMVASMRRSGIYVDLEYLRGFADYLKKEEDRITGLVLEMTGYRVNLASPDQVADLLFRRLMIKPRFQLKLVPSGKREILDDEVLESLKDLHPVIELVQEFRECNKIRTSFAETLPNYVDVKGRIHGDIKMTRVVTGRFSMSDPNLTAQPTRSDLGKRIRRAFKAPSGRLLAEIDLSQAQMRLLAHASGCLNMIDIFLRNGDIHSETASKMFHLPIDQLDANYHRYPAKRTGFGVVFMITGQGLKAQLVIAADPRWTPEKRQEYREFWTEERCDEMIVDWLKPNSEVKEYMNEKILCARRHSMVWDMFGRPRLTPGIRSVHKHIRADAEREAGNSPIQAAEAGIIKLGMAEIWDIIQDRKWDCDPLLCVHDSLLFEGGDNLPEYMREFERVFANGVPLDVPMKSDWKIGDTNWADLKKQKVA